MSRTLHRVRWTSAVVLVALLGVVSESVAQDAGSIEGTITDDSGGVLPGVTVTATNTQTQRSRTVVSDARGEYRIRTLEAGSYDVQAVLPGFRTDPTSVSVGEGVSSLDIVFGIAPLAETVTVTRTGQELSAVPTAVSVVGRETIETGAA